MAISRSQLAKELEPGLNALFGLEYDRYDQEHAEDRIRTALEERGYDSIEVVRVEGLSDDLDGTRKIIARIVERAKGGEF